MFSCWNFLLTGECVCSQLSVWVQWFIECRKTLPYLEGKINRKENAKLQVSKPLIHWNHGFKSERVKWALCASETGWVPCGWLHGFSLLCMAVRGTILHWERQHEQFHSFFGKKYFFLKLCFSSRNVGQFQELLEPVETLAMKDTKETQAAALLLLLCFYLTWFLKIIW